MKKLLPLASLTLIILGAYTYYARTPLPTPPTPKSATLSGVVVPHHDLVASFRSEFFNTVSTHISPPDTIILVSPNHYSTGRGRIQTTDKSWTVLNGTVEPNKKIVRALIDNSIATDEPISFTDEHGIYNILKDIHAYFPNARIVPIILKQLSEDSLDTLHQKLLDTCADCLLIASVDFSHYQPALLADIHDARTLRFLQNLDIRNLLTEAEVDSGSSLALLARWAQSHDTHKFVPWKQTNSGAIYNDPDMETTTHIFGWYEQGEKTVPTSSVSFTIAGDTLFARYIGSTFGNNMRDAFALLGDRVFWGTDARILNLEGSITTQPITEQLDPNSTVFTFPPSIISALSYIRINSVSQANNHSDNAGAEGIDTTRRTLASAGIQTCGGPWSNDIPRVAYFKGEGLTLALVCINLTYPGQNPESALSTISSLAQDETMRILVMPHWGVEYATKHSPAQERAAHMWIDAGADMVIGAHPHVIQDTELYRGAPIIYSLGNFLFDQVDPATKTGLIVSGTFTENALSWFALPVVSDRFAPRLLVGEQKRKILDTLYAPFTKTSTTFGDTINIIKE